MSQHGSQALTYPQWRVSLHDWRDLFHPYLHQRPHETLLVVGLDERSHMVAFVEQTGSRWHVAAAALAVRRVLGHPATSTLVMAHNHPDGPATPSPCDRVTTRSIARLARAANAMLIDHLILAGDDWFSFAENRLI